MSMHVAIARQSLLSALDVIFRAWTGAAVKPE